jgi:exodeoxyribonuclease V gamma subunit
MGTAADLLTDVGPAEAWQRTQLEGLLAGVREEAAGAGSGLTLSEMRSLLGDRLRGRPGRANFRTGDLTVCTLVPMRSVPHRVVCLLGLDDGAFPRPGGEDGDDLLARDPQVGDPDRRGEDRQLLLDALLAAGDALVVTYSGRNERTNAVSHPAVPVGELLDAVDATARTAGGGPARDQVVRAHPLQPFDPVLFRPGALGTAGPWSFDRVDLRGARRSALPREAARGFLEGPLPPLEEEVIELGDLVRFLCAPVETFLRRRLRLRFVSGEEEATDDLPLEPDALVKWGVGDRVLRSRLAGLPLETALAAERSRGVLPPGDLATPILHWTGVDVEALVAAAGPVAGSGSRAVNVAVGGTRLVGTVPGVLGPVLQSVSYSRLGPKARLTAWVRLLALAAADPGAGFRARTVGRARSGARGKRVSVAELLAPGPEAVGNRLGDLVGLYREGMEAPLPLFLKTSAAWAEAIGAGRSPEAAAAKEWNSDWDFEREEAEAAHRQVHGTLGFEELAAAVPLDRYARRLWNPILAAETVTDR